MTKVVYKYKLEILTIQNVTLPINSEILSIQKQRDELYLWALIELNEDETETRCIEINGTGYNLNYNMNINRTYLTTVCMSDNLVLHIFELINQF